MSQTSKASSQSKSQGVTDSQNLQSGGWRQFSKKHSLVIIASVFINLLGLAFPLFLLQIYDRIIPNNAVRSLIVLVLIVIGAVTLEIILKVLRSIVVSWSNVRTEYLEQKTLVTTLLNSDLKTYEIKGAGDYLERLRNISSLRENLSGQSLINYIDMPFAAVFIFLVWYLGGILVAVPVFLLLILTVIYIYVTKHINSESYEQKQNSDRRSNFLIELLDGMHTIKTLALEKLLMRRYDRLQTRATEVNYNLKRYNTIIQTALSLISQFNTVLIVSLGSVLVIQGKMTVGGLAACTLLSARMIQPVTQVLGQKQRELLQKDEKQKISAIRDIEQTTYSKVAQKTIITNASIEFRNVSFGYSNEALLHNINLEIPGKSTVGITGTSASGKSTLLQLITGVITPDKGEILIDGNNIDEYNSDYLHRAIGFLTQERYLFTGTILENLTMFEENNRHRAFELTKELGLESLIVKLPKGYHTEVGSTAVELLAPGIKQMITIVRSLVNDDLKIILFDEANMALDLPSDFNLIKFLKKLQRHCTMVLVSYRPSILNLANKQYYLDKGGLLEQKNT